MLFGGVKSVSGRNLAGGNFNVFACGAPTSGPMEKRRPQLDSAGQIGVGSTAHDLCDCSGDGDRGG